MSRLKINALWILPIMLLSVLSLTYVTYANNASKPLGPEWRSVFSKFNLQSVSVLPPGVQPLRVSSPTELADIIQRLESASQGYQHFVVVWTPRLGKSRAGGSHFAAITKTDATETYVPLHKQELIDWVCRVYFNLWADVWVAGSGSFWEITDVYQWVGLTGMTTFYDLSSEYSYHHISSDSQSVYILGRATVNYLLSKRL